MQEVFLDNSASTPPFPEVTELMSDIQRRIFGNPASLHRKGLEAEKTVAEARSAIARSLGGVAAEEIIFTSGGTEANNLAVRGAAQRMARRGKHLITSLVEHPSVLKTFQLLSGEGYKLSLVKVDKQGIVDLDHLASLVTPSTTLVSIIHASNETGCIQPIAEACRLVKSKNPETLFHADCVQSYGKLPLEPAEINPDMLTLSAHKIHGPKGAGALWVKKGTLLTPLFGGGDQEGGLRPGTENVPGIAGFGRAAELYLQDIAGNNRHLSGLKEAFIQTLSANINLLINGPDPNGTGAVPHIVNMAFPGLKAEVLVHALEEHGIYASPGSACHSRRPAPSHVLLAMGIDGNTAGSSLRFSFSVMNTVEEARQAAGSLVSVVKELQKLII